MIGTIISWATLIHISEDGGRLEAIDRFFNQCVPAVELPPALFTLSLNQGLEFFSNESNEVGLIWGPVSIKLDNGNA